MPTRGEMLQPTAQNQSPFINDRTIEKALSVSEGVFRSSTAVAIEWAGVVELLPAAQHEERGRHEVHRKRAASTKLVSRTGLAQGWQAVCIQTGSRPRRQQVVEADPIERSCSQLVKPFHGLRVNCRDIDRGGGIPCGRAGAESPKLSYRILSLRLGQEGFWTPKIAQTAAFNWTASRARSLCHSLHGLHVKRLLETFQ